MAYGDAPAVSVDKFYDRYTRSWVLMYKDADGYQTGDAIYIGSGKADALQVEAQMVAALPKALLPRLQAAYYCLKDCWRREEGLAWEVEGKVYAKMEELERRIHRLMAP